VPSKVTDAHLGRKAIVYLRQSTDRQVQRNTESLKLQYGLVDRAKELGFAEVEVIESDLGKSASMGAKRREGFDRLIAAVAVGEVGIVLSREVSRLSRTDKDWCRLLEVCQVFGTLIGDEEQLYDLRLTDDQLILGIKGTMSVMELNVLKIRMQAGMEAKARRGELLRLLPPGYVYDKASKVVKDPDLRVQQAIELAFRVFHETGRMIGTTIARTWTGWRERGSRADRELLCWGWAGTGAAEREGCGVDRGGLGAHGELKADGLPVRCSREDRLPPFGGGEMRSVQGGGIQTGWRLSGLDEMPQDLEYLRGVDDHGDDFHPFVTARAAQRIRIVDLLDEPGPCGAALLGRHGQLGLRLVGRADAEGWLRWMVAFPALGSEAEKVRATGPGAASPRGVQAIAANESAPRVR